MCFPALCLIYKSVFHSWPCVHCSDLQGQQGFERGLVLGVHCAGHTLQRSLPHSTLLRLVLREEHACQFERRKRFDQLV